MARTPTTAFCLLYKFFTLRLTERQLRGLLVHKDSPYIRGIGFLYLRYLCPPTLLYERFEPYLDDTEELDLACKGPSPPRVVTIGELCKMLLVEKYYYGSLLPRIPVPVHRDICRKVAEYLGEPVAGAEAGEDAPRRMHCVDPEERERRKQRERALRAQERAESRQQRFGGSSDRGRQAELTRLRDEERARREEQSRPPVPAPAPAPVEEEEDIFAAARSICNQRATPASAAPMHSPPQDRKRGRSPPPRRGEDWDRRGDRRGDRRDDRRDEHREDSRRDEHREERRGDRRDEHRVDRRGDRRDERREDRRGDRHDRRRHHRHRSHRSRSRPSSPRRHSPRSPHARSSRSAERSLRSSRPRSRSPEASAPTSATSIQARLSMLKAKYGEQNASAGPAQARNAPSLSQPNTSTVVLRTNRVTSKFYRTMAQ